MHKLIEIYDFIDEIAPFALAQPWDNCGILIGEKSAKISRILVALDVTPEVLEEAKAKKADLIIAHHPLIFHAVKKIDSSSHLYNVLASGINVIAAHTNLDASPKGVNVCLANALDLLNLRPILPAKNGVESADYSEGALAELPQEMTTEQFANHCKQKLGTPHVGYVCAGKKIKTVAFCGGSKGDLAVIAKGMADAVLTGELKHSDYLDGLQNGLSVISAGHYYTEAVVVKPLADMLAEKFPSMQVFATECEKPVPLYV